MIESFCLETLLSMLNESIYHYLFRAINLIHNACLLLNFSKKCTGKFLREILFLLMATCLIMSIIKLFKKVYKEILKGNSILTNGHMFDHVYY